MKNVVFTIKNSIRLLFVAAFFFLFVISGGNKVEAAVAYDDNGVEYDWLQDAIDANEEYGNVIYLMDDVTEDVVCSGSCYIYLEGYIFEGYFDFRGVFLSIDGGYDEYGNPGVMYSEYGSVVNLYGNSEGDFYTALFYHVNIYTGEGDEGSNTVNIYGNVDYVEFSNSVISSHGWGCAVPVHIYSPMGEVVFGNNTRVFNYNYSGIDVQSAGDVIIEDSHIHGHNYAIHVSSVEDYVVGEVTGAIYFRSGSLYCDENVTNPNEPSCTYGSQGLINEGEGQAVTIGGTFPAAGITMGFSATKYMLAKTRINSIYFATLQEAVRYATQNADGLVIWLLADVNECVTTYTDYLFKGTIDFNGYTLTCDNYSGYAIRVERSDDEVTLRSGFVVGDNAAIYNNGTLLIGQSMNISSTRTGTSSRAIYNLRNLTVNDSGVVIAGAYGIYNDGGSANATITSGRVVGNNYNAIKNNGAADLIVNGENAIIYSKNSRAVQHGSGSFDFGKGVLYGGRSFSSAIDGTVSVLGDGELTHELVSYDGTTVRKTYVVFPNYVAQIGTTKYYSLVDAVDDVFEDGIITLLSNVDECVTLTYTSFELYLNGFTWSGTCGVNFYVSDNDDFVYTIYGGTIVAGDMGAIWISKGTVNLGEVQIVNHIDYPAIHVDGSGNAVIDVSIVESWVLNQPTVKINTTGSVVIRGGSEIHSQSYNGINISKGELTIQDMSKISGENYAIYKTGGTVYFNSGIMYAPTKPVYSGTFILPSNMMLISSLVTESYRGGSYYTERLGLYVPSVASLDGTFYASLADAISDLTTTSKTITLLSNTSECITIDSAKVGVIDLGGYTWSCDVFYLSWRILTLNHASANIEIKNGTMTDTGELYEGETTSSNWYSIGVNYGRLKLSSNLVVNGTVDVYSTGYLDIAGASVNAGTENDGNLYTSAVLCSGTCTMSSGSVVSIPEWYGFTTKSGSDVTITGGNIAFLSVAGNGSISGSADISSLSIGSNNGNLTMSGGTVDSISNYGTFTMTGGTFDNVLNQLGTFINFSGGTSTITGGTIKDYGTNFSVINSGTLTIDNVTIIGAGNGIRNLTSATLTINGGTIFSSAKYAVENSGTFNFNGGDLYANSSYSKAYSGSAIISSGKVEISESGTYSDSAVMHTYLISGVAKIGSTYYDTLAAAANALTSTSKTITLIQNVTECITISSAKVGVIDLNGKTWSCETTSSQRLLTITNGTANIEIKNGTMVDTSVRTSETAGLNSVWVTAGGTLKFSGSTFELKGNVEALYTSHFLMSGGTITGNSGYSSTLSCLHDGADCQISGGTIVSSTVERGVIINGTGSSLAISGGTVETLDARSGSTVNISGGNVRYLISRGTSVNVGGTAVIGYVAVSGGIFTMTGGSIDNVNDIGTQTFYVSGGTANLNGGIIKSYDSAIDNHQAYAIYNYSSGIISIDGTTIVSTEANGAINNVGTLTINSGTVVSESGYAVYNTGTFNFNGGELYAPSSYAQAYSGTVTVASGKSIGNVSATYDGATYMKTYLIDGVAKINSTYYATLAAAVNALTTTSKTITLLKNVNEDINVTTAKVGVIDLNGKTWSGSYPDYIPLTINHSNANIEVKNGILYGLTGSTDKPCSLETCSVLVYNGTLKLGDELEANSGVFVDASGVLNIAGATVHTVSYNGNVIDDMLRDVLECHGTCSMTSGFVSHVLVYDEDSSFTMSGGSIDYIYNNGTFNMSAGTIQNISEYDAYNSLFTNSGTATITGGTIVVDEGYQVKNQGNLTINDVSFTVNGSTSSEGLAAIYNRVDQPNVASVTINGGTFTSNACRTILWNRDDAVITGGSFIAKSCASVIFSVIENSRDIYWDADDVQHSSSCSMTINNIFIDSFMIGIDSSAGSLTINSGTILSRFNYAVIIGSYWNFYFNGGVLYAKSTYTQAYDGDIRIPGGMEIVNASATYNSVSYMSSSLVEASVAKIGTTYYNTLAAAVDTLTTTSKTITLLSDVTECITISSAKVGVIDLGGYTWSCETLTGATTSSVKLLTINNASANIELKNGTMVDTSTRSSTNADYWFSIYVYTGTLKISGSLFELQGNISVATNGTLNITGGTITGNSIYQYTILCYGDCAVSGGTITSSAYGVAVENGSISVSGGNISKLYMYEEATITGGTIGDLYVGGSGSGANISGGTITNISVNDAGTVTINSSSVTVSDSVTVCSGGTFVMNGGNVAKISNYGVTEVQSGTVSGNITNSSGGSFTISGGTISRIIINSSTLTISGGLVKTSSTSITNNSGATLTISGGTVVSTGSSTYAVSNSGTFNWSGGVIHHKKTPAYSGSVATNKVINTISDTSQGATYRSYLDTGVAKIDSMYYATLAAAVDALTTTSKTITLLKNVTECITISSAKVGVIDLNDKTWGCNVNYLSTRILAVNHASANIEVINGTMDDRGNLPTSLSAGKHWYSVESVSGTLTLGADLTLEGSIKCYANATLNIDGAIIDRQALTYNSGVDRHPHAVECYGSCTMSSGNVVESSSDTEIFAFYGYEGSNVSISGGTLPTLYIYSTATVTGGNIIYFTIQSGASVTVSGTTMKHVYNYGVLNMSSSTIINDNEVDNFATLLNDGTATITNSVITEEYGSSNNYGISNDGSLTIDNTTIESAGSGISNDGEFTMNSGTITANGCDAFVAYVLYNIGVANLNGGTLNYACSGSNEYAVKNAILSNSEGILNLNGATIENTGPGVSNSGTFNFSSGTIIAGSGYAVNTSSSSGFSWTGGDLYHNSANAYNSVDAGSLSVITVDGSEKGTTYLTKLVAAVARIGTTYYATLSDAVNALGTDENTEIVLLDSVVEDRIVIGTVKKGKINLSGFEWSCESGLAICLTITSADAVLNIYNGTMIGGNQYALNNRGSLTLNAQIDGIVRNSASLIVNGGEFETLMHSGGNATINDATITTVSVTSGTVSLKGGDITSIVLSGGTVNVEGATVNETITNEGTVNVSSGEVKGTITNNSGGTVTVSSSGKTAAITNSGTLNVTGGTTGAITNSATLEVSAGIVKTSSTTITNNSGATFTLSGGKVVSTGSGTYAVSNSGTFNWSGGELHHKTSAAYSGTAPDVGARVIKTKEDSSQGATYSSYLVGAVAKIGNVYYESVYSSMGGMLALNSTDTVVELLTNVDECLIVDLPIKGIFDLKGYTWDCSAVSLPRYTISLSNRGISLTITNGTINSSTDGAIVLDDEGLSLTLSNVAINGFVYTTNIGEIGNQLIINTGTVIISSGVAVRVAEYVTMTINGGTIKSTGDEDYAIDNYGTIQMSGGTVEGKNIGISNNDGAILTVSGGTVKAAGGSTPYAIENYSEVTISSNAIIDCSNVAVMNYNGATLTMNGGTVNNGGAMQNDGTFNLSGGTINGRVLNTETFNMTNGTVTNSSSYSTVTNDLGGTATISGGNVKYTGTANVCAVSNVFTTTAVPTLTISGGKVESSTCGVNNPIKSSTKAVLNVSGGTIVAKNGYAVTNNGTFNWSNGVLHHTTDVAYSGSVSLTGTNKAIVVSSDTSLGATKKSELKPAVAKISSTYYNTLASAVSALGNSGSTVTLLTDVVEYIIVESAIVGTIDLNDKTWSYNVDGYSTFEVNHVSADIVVKNGDMISTYYRVINLLNGKLKLENVDISSVDEDNSGYAVLTKWDSEFTMVGGSAFSGHLQTFYHSANTGTMTLTDVNVTSYGQYAIYNSGENLVINGGTFTIDNRYSSINYPAIYHDDGNLTINEGSSGSVTTINAEAGILAQSNAGTSVVINNILINATDARGIAVSGPSVTINDGVIKGTSGIFVSSGSLTLNGGVIVGTSDFAVNNAGTFNWNDGELYGLSTNSTAYTPSESGSSYLPVLPSNNVIISVASTYEGSSYMKSSLTNAVAVIGSTYYGTLTAAINALGSTSKTITLIQNVTECVTISSAKVGVIDLNGKTWTCTTANTYTLNITATGADIEIKGGTMSATYRAIQNKGTLKITSGTIGTIDNAAGTATLSGGGVDSGKVTGGTMNVEGSVVEGDIENSAVLNVKSGIVGGTIINNATLNVSGGSPGAITNAAGTATLSGGTTGVVTVNGGTVTVSGATVSGAVTNKATLNVSSGEVKGTITNNTGGTVTISSSGKTAAITNNATLKVTAGTTGAITNAAGTATLSGGTVASSSVAITNNSGATLEISGGTVVSSGTSSYAVNNAGTFKFTGGALYGASTSRTAYTPNTDSSNLLPTGIPSGKNIVTKIETYSGSARRKSYIGVAVASITADSITTYYATIQDAIDDLITTSRTIKLLSNVTECVTVSSSSVGVIDLNSKTWSCTTASTYTLNITGTSANIEVKNGNLVSNASAIYNAGTLTVSGSSTKIVGKGGYAVNNAGTFNFNAGKLYAASTNATAYTPNTDGSTYLPKVPSGNGINNSTETYDGVSYRMSSLVSAAAKITVSNVTTYYASLLDAINTLGSSSKTIVVLTNRTECITISSTKVGIIDLNNKTWSCSEKAYTLDITGTSANIEIKGGTVNNGTTGSIQNNGTLKVSGGTVGIINNKKTLNVTGGSTGNITNSAGTTTISGGTINGTVVNGATFNVSNGSIEGNVTSNAGTVSMSGGSITGRLTAGNTTNSTSSQVTITNGTITGGIHAYVSSTVTISNITFDDNDDDSAIYIASGSTMTISGGSFTVDRTDGNGMIDNYGTLSVSGSAVMNFSSNNQGVYIFNNTGSVMTMTGGEINFAYTGSDSSAIGSGIDNKGTLTITGGTITGSKVFYLINNNDANASVTIGDSNSTISDTSPVIDSNATMQVAIYVPYGTFNYYNGAIIAANNASYTYKLNSGATFNRRSNTEEWTTIVDSKLKTVLVNAVAKIGSTSYDTLANAIAAGSGKTITLQKSITLQSTTISVSTTIDLGSYTINNYVKDVYWSSNSYNLFTINANVTIKGTSGTITSNSGGVYVNSGKTFSIGASGDTLSATYPTIKAISGYAVDSAGKFNFYNGKLISSESAVFNINAVNLAIRNAHHIKYVTASPYAAYLVANVNAAENDTISKGNTITISADDSFTTINVEGTKALSGSVSLVRENGDEVVCTKLSSNKTFYCASFFDETKYLLNATYSETLKLKYTNGNSSLQLITSDDDSNLIFVFHRINSTVQNSPYKVESGKYELFTDNEIILVNKFTGDSFTPVVTEDFIKAIYGSNVGSIITNLSTLSTSNLVTIASVSDNTCSSNGCVVVQANVYTFSPTIAYKSGLPDTPDDVTVKIIVYDYSPKVGVSDIDKLTSLSNTCEYLGECAVEELTFMDYKGQRIDNVETIITLNGVVVNSIDTSVIGKYIVTTRAVDTNGYTSADVVREYNVVDSVAPVIEMDSSAVVLELGHTYSDRGIIAYDNYDKDVRIERVSSVNFDKAGEYVVTYKAIDSSGNVTYIDRIVIVKESNNSILYIILGVIIAMLVMIPVYINSKRKKVRFVE